jgi:polysaccharide export outer membrane protein
MYLLGPGDEIKTKVLGESQFDFEASVDENGNIEVPFFEEPVRAMCRTERDVKNDIVKMLSKYLRNPQVTFNVSERKSRVPVTITGEVRTPAQVTMMRETRLLELLSFTGGEIESAGGNVEVFQTRPPMCDSKAFSEWQAEVENSSGFPSRVYSLNSIKSGSSEANPVINPGDLIIVQKAAPIYVVGEVRSPQGLFIKNGGLSLTQAIAMVGGVNREAKTKDIKIYRLRSNSIDRNIISVNLDSIKKGEQKDIMLEPNDQIEVDKTKKSIAQTILEIAIGAGKGAVGGFTNVLPQRVLY